MKQTKVRRKKHINLRRLADILEPVLFFAGFFIVFAVAGTSDVAAMEGKTISFVRSIVEAAIGGGLAFLSLRIRAILRYIERRMR